ncbi:MAG: DUF3102 domain-containing protein [Treponematales bacterium]
MAKKTAIKDSAAIVQVKESIAEVDKNYGDGMPYELTRLENELRFYQEQVGLGLLEMGKRLIVIKAHEEHGSWLEVLNRLGISPRLAQFAMLAARKFSNTKAPSYLGNEKVRALTVLDEEDIAKLDAGEAVKGVGTLDDIERMTTRELREALRKERDKRQKEGLAKDNVISKNNEKINEMELRLAGQELPTEEAKWEAMALKELERLRRDLFENIKLARFHFGRCLALIEEAQKIEGVTFPMLEAWALDEDDQLREFPELAEQLADALAGAHPYREGEDGSED